LADVADHYAAGLERHLALTADLGESEADTRTAACPEWTVRDVYAHLAGAAADVLDGRTDGAGTDAWTGRQVEERRGRTLTQIVDEYAERGPQLVEALRAFPIERLAVDQWSHEQDVRGALGRPGSRDAPVVGWAIEWAMGGMAKAWAEAARAPVRIITSSGEFDLGTGPSAATFATDDFELLRALTGRRSQAQIRAWSAPGSDDAAVEATVATLPFFPPRPDDLHE